MAQTWQSPESEGFYDINQLNKRLEWLDAERRKDKDQIVLLQEQVSQLRGEILAYKQTIKDFQEEISPYAPVFGRLDQLESLIPAVRNELLHMVEDTRKIAQDKDAELEANQNSMQESLSRAILSVRKQVEPLADIKKSVQARMDDIFVLNRTTEELSHRIDKIALERDDFLRFQKTNEESRKQDAKRLADMQGELSAYRKRNEEMRTKVDLSTDTIKKMEQRILELISGENERRQLLTTFFEKANIADVNREKTMQDWKSSFDEIVEKASSLDVQVQSLDATKRSIKRSQDALDESTARFDRRTNEITEMQRLMEEKFRQEWASFKADDQKRWMNYTLGQEEIQSEYKRSTEMLVRRLDKLEDTAVSTYDENTQREEQRTAQLQELFALVRSWLERGS